MAQAEHKENANAGASAPQTEGEAKREQSGIEFPYGDLDAAIGVARDIASIGGQSCELEQLAGLWRVVPSGGGFRARYAPARIFGLLTADKGRLSLTPLGMRIIDPTQQASARVDAFLAVGLYKAVYEKYKNYQLPSTQALEGEMVKLGVAQKQKDKARQVFMRSARNAGFFWAGEDRLVRPNVAAPLPAAPDTLPQEAADRMPPQDRESNYRSGGLNGGGAGGSGQYHPFIQGLLQTLPEPGTLWTVEGRAAWLQAAAQNFTLIYKGEGKIDVQITTAAAKADKAAA